jgi:ectoine hydroxylase-related dioxygenase (phytanoyl-CoA dioxygenase family)
MPQRFILCDQILVIAMSGPRYDVSQQQIDQYREAGAAVLRGILDPHMIAEAERVFQWSIDNPSSAAQRYYESSGTVFHQDLFNTLSWGEYRHLFTDSHLPDVVSQLWNSADVWFFFEQIFLKSGGETRRTPWHQDTSYFPVDGPHLAVFWICLEPVSQENSLEFVRGSHVKTIYNGSAFSEADDTAPLYPEGSLPRLPDIETERHRWDVISWALEPGDAVIFHPSTLHGGAPTHPGEKRRTISLRYFGEDARFVERPAVAKQSEVGFNREESNSRNIEDFMVGLKPGDPFRNPEFVQVRPIAAS